MSKKPLSLLVPSLVAALAITAALLSHPPALADEPSCRGRATVETHAVQFKAAMTSYEQHHWPAAFAQFVELADKGHADAARIAMQMLRHGPRLYGQEFTLTPRRVERFSAARLRTQALDVATAN